MSVPRETDLLVDAAKEEKKRAVADGGYVDVSGVDIGPTGGGGAHHHTIADMSPDGGHDGHHCGDCGGCDGDCHHCGDCGGCDGDCGGCDGGGCDCNGCVIM